MSSTVDPEQRITNMRTLQEANENLEKIIQQKRNLDSITHPDPGRNTKRIFNNALHDVNRSPVNIEKQSARVYFGEQVPRIDGPHEQRFEPF